MKHSLTSLGHAARLRYERQVLRYSESETNRASPKEKCPKSKKKIDREPGWNSQTFRDTETQIECPSSCSSPSQKDCHAGRLFLAKSPTRHFGRSSLWLKQRWGLWGSFGSQMSMLTWETRQVRLLGLGNCLRNTK